ncbi:MAG TPA: ATP-binding protein [Stellaceae bacterium]|nr:ATP-binding protein [Stellaceae bacterium]
MADDTRERYRQKLARITLDSMVQFVGLLDAHGTVLEINQVALDGVGIDLSTVEGKPFWTTFWWQVSDEINATLTDSIRRAAQGEFVRWDTEIYGRAGGTETIIIDASLMPVRDERGKVVFITAEGRDITEKKAYEREIARQREELAKLDELKTAFFANISHEFRTPLTLMLGPIEDALDDGAERLGPRQRERIAMVQRNGLRLQKLVNTLLDFSRVEAGRIQAVYQATDLAALTQDLASSFRAACEKAGLSLAIETARLAEPVFVDREMWEKIVLNLVSNAFKFTLVGGIEISLGAADGEAVLRVRDTGTGIPEKELPLIFERFHRVEGAQGRTHEGTGIGLALVQELVKLHKGSIAVESTLGRGTVFTVRVPFGSAHLPPVQVDAARTQASTATRTDAFVSEALRWLPDGIVGDGVDAASFPPPPTPDAVRARVVLADDNADMRDYLSRLLAPRYDVAAVADGEAALAAAARLRPDLVLTDIMMPRVDGFALLQRLRADPALREIPVILLSARAGEEAKIEGIEAGADDYLVKPFNARELLARVASNIELAHARAQTAAILRQMNETLEQRVAAEVADRMKAEEALRQAQKMEAIGQLTGGVAHDFNNLLQVVLGHLDALKRRMDAGGADSVPSRADIARPVDAAVRAAERAASLTQRLLAFARRQPLDPRPVDVNRLVGGMSELLHRTLGESIAIETVLGGGLWRISADPNQLESAILNLAVNARDAMPEGGKLTIESANARLDETYAGEHQEVRPGQYVMLAVSDTGSGMTKEVIASAFDPFFTTKEIGQGTGLGLSQVYGFVKQSNGHVKIYSEPGDGTTVRIYLPRLMDDTAVEEELREVSFAGGDGNEIILLVEDDAAVRELNAAMLKELAYTVIEADDGAKALKLLAAVPNIRLLFTDVGLPGALNGRQLADLARQKHPSLKVLFTTGYARNAIVHHGRLDPGIDLISKPFTVAALANKIREILDRP